MSKYKVEFEYVDEYSIERLHKLINIKGLEHSCYVDCNPNLEELKEILKHDEWYIVRLDGEDYGYVYLELGTETTTAIHWGCVSEDWRFFIVLTEGMEWLCNNTPYINYIGIIKEDNVVAMKIAKRIGFKYVTSYINHYEGSNFIVCQYTKDTQSTEKLRKGERLWARLRNPRNQNRPQSQKHHQ